MRSDRNFKSTSSPNKIFYISSNQLTHNSTNDSGFIYFWFNNEDTFLFYLQPFYSHRQSISIYFILMKDTKSRSPNLFFWLHFIFSSKYYIFFVALKIPVRIFLSKLTNLFATSWRQYPTEPYIRMGLVSYSNNREWYVKLNRNMENGSDRMTN